MKNKWLIGMACLAIGACGSEENESTPPDAQNDEFVIAEDSKSDAQGIQEFSYDAICVLSFVNQADESTIRDLAHDWPADSIVEFRAGADGEIGTEDDGILESVEALDDLDWVGFFTFQALENHAKENDFCPKLGEETLIPNEDFFADEIAKESMALVREKAMEDEIARRDAHAKAHGCVQAFVTVDNKDLEDEEKIGLFSENLEYPAWMRFSNGNPVIQNDKSADARGMAIKIMDVAGEKVLDRHKAEKTQDFLLINGPDFFVRTPADYLEFTKKAFDGSPFTFFLSLNPLDWKIRELTNTLRIALAKPSSPITQYWSTVPYALGDNAAVKYTAKPCGDFGKGFPDDPTPDFLGETLAEQLAEGEQCFEFMFQRQIDAGAMPIEDATIGWDDSPFVKAATIRIPQQSFLSDAQKDFCENLEFNPWHTLPEHRPLGNINRTRRVVYDAISDLRHTLNMVERAEPTQHIDFE